MNVDYIYVDKIYLSLGQRVGDPRGCLGTVPKFAQLDEPALERHRGGEEEGVEGGAVEALADERAGAHVWVRDPSWS